MSVTFTVIRLDGGAPPRTGDRPPEIDARFSAGGYGSFLVRLAASAGLAREWGPYHAARRRASELVMRRAIPEAGENLAVLEKRLAQAQERVAHLRQALEARQEQVPLLRFLLSDHSSDPLTCEQCACIAPVLRAAVEPWTPTGDGRSGPRECALSVADAMEFVAAHPGWGVAVID